jgi:chromosome partitioning protein
MRTIAVINQKGGCGKTTVSINLAAALAHKDFKTLLIDMDPQSHCAVGLAVPQDQVEKNSYDLLISSRGANKVELKHVAWQISQNFELIPAGIELAALEPQLAGQDRREDCLRDILASQAGKYDFVVIDCPPSVGLLTFNALRAADAVIIPVETGYFALHGLAREMETLQVLRQQCQQEIDIHVLASMYDVRTKLAREVFNELKSNYSSSLLSATVNFNTRLKEAASFGQPITEYDPSCRGMRDFLALADEIVGSHREKAVRKEQVESVEDQLQAMSKTANELLAESEKTIGTKTILQNPNNSIEEKIDHFYGIRQEQGKVEFTVLYPNAKVVQLAGDFNNWQPENTQLHQSNGNGRWDTELRLEGGVYHYRYVVDGHWQQDPYNNQIATNPFGENDSVLEVV